MDTIKIDKKQVSMIAHRGLCGIERENTNAAFIAAANRSYFGIETDIHRTLDGKYVILHDETTSRVSNKLVNINVEKSTYDEIQKVVLPDLDGSTHRQDLRIPLLQDYIKICKKYNKICILEFKNKFEPEYIEEVIQLIKAEDYLEHVIFISFVLENCISVRHFLPTHPVQWLIGETVTEKIKENLYKYHFALDVTYNVLTKELIDELHAHQIAVNCWTCNDKTDAEKLVEMGVDFITTNILE